MWLTFGGSSTPMVLVLNSAFSSDLMSRSQRLGVITLSLKRGDRLDPQ